MKKILVITALFATLLSFGQEKKWERIKALKTAYITEELALTAAEAEAFWPIYNEFEEKKWKLKKAERREVFAKLRDLEAMSNAEAQALINKSVQFQEEELALHEKLFKDLQNVISAKKTIKLKKAEEDFKRQLLERFKDKKERKN